MSFSLKSFSILKRDLFLFVARMFSGIVVARTLGPELLGLWSILQLIPGYAEAFGRFKFDMAAVYFLGKKEAKLGEMIFTINMIALLTSIIIIGVFVWQFDWIYGNLFKNTPVDMRLLTYFILAIIPINFLLTNYNYLNIYLEDIKTYNRMVVINALLSSGIGVFLLLVFDWGIYAMLTGSILGIGTSLFYGAFKIAKIEKMIPNWNPKLLKKMAGYVIYSYLGGIISHLNIYITNLMVALYLSPSSVAFFSMSKTQGRHLNKIPNALSTLLFPQISKIDTKEEASQLTARAFRITLIMLLIAGAILAIIIKPFIYIFYGEAFLPAVLPFLIIVPGIVIFQSTTIIGQYFNGVGRTDLGPKIGIIPMIIQGVLAYLLIQKYSIIGASIAFAIYSFLFSLIQLGVFLKVSSSNISILWITKEDVNTVTQFILSQLIQFKNKFIHFIFK